MHLALDVATRVGWASGEVGGTPTFGVADFSSKGGNGEVLARFRMWLMREVEALKPDLIAFEAPYIPIARAPQFVRSGTEFGRAAGGAPPMNPIVLRRLLAMVGLVEEIAFEHQIRCREATNQEIAKFFIGKARVPGGRPAKKLMTIEACRRLGWQTVSDDAADGLALWSFAEHILAPDVSSRRSAGAGLELPLHGLLAPVPVQQRIGRRVLS